MRKNDPLRNLRLLVPLLLITALAAATAGCGKSVQVDSATAAPTGGGTSTSSATGDPTGGVPIGGDPSQSPPQQQNQTCQVGQWRTWTFVFRECDKDEKGSTYIELTGGYHPIPGTLDVRLDGHPVQFQFDDSSDSVTLSPGTTGGDRSTVTVCACAKRSG
jgi:hypothetical protein